MFSTDFGPIVPLCIVRKFGSKLRSPPLQANCNPNTVSVQCVQVAIGALVSTIVLIVSDARVT